MNRTTITCSPHQLYGWVRSFNQHTDENPDGAPAYRLVEADLRKRRVGRGQPGENDEIASIDETVQVSLLRLIQARGFQRLGGSRSIGTDARLIAASNQDLAQEVQDGTFREDLYYRLDVFRITLPPLRERPGDIPLLIEEFLKRYNARFYKNVRGISGKCVALLEASDWPGNVRELKNVIQRAVLVCEEDVLLPEHLPPRFRDMSPPPGTVDWLLTSFEVAATGKRKFLRARSLGVKEFEDAVVASTTLASECEMVVTRKVESGRWKFDRQRRETITREDYEGRRI